MTDKERILTTLAVKFLFETHQCTLGWSSKDKAQPGDLIMSASTGVHDFTFGYYAGIGEDGEYLMRELDSERTCKMYNDAFFIIPKDWFSSIQLLYGKERAMEEKVRKATSKLEWGYRYGGAEFDGNVCTAKVRKVFSDDILFTVAIPYSSKTTIKSILAAIEQAKVEYEAKAAVEAE